MIIKKVRNYIIRKYNNIQNSKRIKQISKRMEDFQKQQKKGDYREAVIQIHTGRNPIPDYARYCIEQIHILDNAIPIFFVCDKEKDVSCIPQYCTILYEEDLLISKEHLEFLKVLKKKKISDFFQTTIERFYVLYDAMVTIGLENIIHMENDILIYDNATSLIRALKDLYNQIAVPRACKNMCCASLMFVPNQNALKDFLEFINKESDDIYFNDMTLLPAYIDSGRGQTLPTLTKLYVLNNGLKTVSGLFASQNERETDYYFNADILGGIFDCAAIGQFIDGCDFKFHPEKRKGYINEESYLDSRLLEINWTIDEDGMRRPYVIENNQKLLIHNLHIHSKRLNLFMSITPSHT